MHSCDLGFLRTRVFTAGATVTKLRASLDSDDKLVFLNISWTSCWNKRKKIAIKVAQETSLSTPNPEIIQMKQETKSHPQPNQETLQTVMPSLPTLPIFEDWLSHWLIVLCGLTLKFVQLCCMCFCFWHKKLDFLSMKRYNTFSRVWKAFQYCRQLVVH